jgi:hypothetical protein
MQKHDQQQGSLLFFALIMLLIITLLGISAISSTNISLKIAGNLQRQYQAEVIAENTLNFLVASYPSSTMPPTTVIETFGYNVSIEPPTQSCNPKVVIEGSGVPSILACAWTGNGAAHEHFSSTKSCQTGDYTPTRHPHLHGGRELWINGNVIIPYCEGGFMTPGGTINYKGSIINSCREGGTFPAPTVLAANQVTQEEFNAAAGAGPLVGGDYYSQVELRITATDPMSGATATVVKGFKYRGELTNSAAMGLSGEQECDLNDDGTGVIVSPDPWLSLNGSHRVLYSYQEIDE